MEAIRHVIQLSLVPLDIIRWLWHAIAPDALVTLYNLRGKLALVTGAGGGLGALVAKKLASRGCVVVLWDVDAAGLANTQEEIASRGGTAHKYVVNLCDRKQVYETARQVEQEVGSVDIVVNNAGVALGAPLLETDDVSIERTFQVNVLAHFWVLKAFLPAMIERNDGHVVTVASTAGYFGVPRLGAYCSSKAAALNLHMSLLAELAAADEGALGLAGAASRPRRTNRIGSTVVCPYFLRGTHMQLVGDRNEHPILMPYLDVDYVAERIVTAIRRREMLVLTPRFMYFTLALSNFLPLETLLRLQRAMGVSRWYRGVPSPQNIKRVFKD